MAHKPGAALKNRYAAIGAACLLCLFALAGCAAEQQLTASEVDASLAALDAVESSLDDGDCAAAKDAARRVSNITVAVSADAGDDFREAYRQSADRLEELVAEQCEQAPTKETGPTGDTGETGATGPVDVPPDDGGTPAPTPDTGGNQDGGQPDGGQQTPDGGGNQDGGQQTPDSGGVRPE